MAANEELLCLERGGRIECSGPVEYRMMPDNPRSFPRCEAHAERRLEQAQRTLELTSPARAPWYDKAAINEEWDEDE